MEVEIYMASASFIVRTAKTIRLVLGLTVVTPGPAPLLPSFCWASSYPLAGLSLKYELQ